MTIRGEPSAPTANVLTFADDEADGFWTDERLACFARQSALSHGQQANIVCHLWRQFSPAVLRAKGAVMCVWKEHADIIGASPIPLPGSLTGAVSVGITLC